MAPETVSDELARDLSELRLEMRARQMPEDKLWGRDGIVESLMKRQGEFSGINRPYIRSQVVKEAIRRLRLADDQQHDQQHDQQPEQQHDEEHDQEHDQEHEVVAMAQPPPQLGVAVVAVALIAIVFTAIFRLPVSNNITDSIIQDACELHTRWADVSTRPAGQFDLYDVLDSNKVDFSGNIDEFAGRFSRLTEGEHCVRYMRLQVPHALLRADPDATVTRGSANRAPLSPSGSSRSCVKTPTGTYTTPRSFPSSARNGMSSRSCAGGEQGYGCRRSSRRLVFVSGG